MQSAAKAKMGFKEFMKIWIELIKQTYLKLLLISILLVIFISLISTFLLSDSLWNQFLLSDRYEVLYQRVLETPDYQYSEEEQVLIRAYTIVRVSLLILSSTFIFILPTALIMLSINYIMEKSTAKTALVLESLKVPFVKGRFFGSIFYCLFIPLLITFGLIFFVIPGFLVMVCTFFVFHSYYIDEVEGFKPFKLSVEYLKGNFFNVLFSCFIGFGIPILLGDVFTRMFPFIGLSPQAFRTWLNPESRNYLMIFLYHFALYGVQGVFYPILPPLSFVLYTKIKNEKLEEIMREKRERTMQPESKDQVVTVFLKGGQKKFKCPSCGTEMNAGVKKCFQCGKFIKYKVN